MNIQQTNQLPVRPDLLQLRHQAKELLARIRAGDSQALQLFSTAHGGTAPEPKLSAVQFALARSYGVKSWPRLVKACEVCEAIWNDQAESVVQMMLANPELVGQNARGTEGEDNWGPPISYAATTGALNVVKSLIPLDPNNIDRALARASLKGHLEVANALRKSGAETARGAVMGPCETLNPAGLEFLLNLGAKVEDENGDSLGPLAQVLQTYSRDSTGKHACMELLELAGCRWPATPVFALHRGRIDLLQDFLAADAQLFSRNWSHDDIYPRSVGCSTDHRYALHGTPLAGGTLLHLAVDFDEYDILKWMLENGADPNARAQKNADGFGGHTALFGCVVSQPYRVRSSAHERFAELLLKHGADPHIRASLRKELRFVPDESLHEFRNVDCLEWGERFQDQDWVNPRAVSLIRQAIEHKST